MLRISFLVITGMLLCLYASVVFYQPSSTEHVVKENVDIVPVSIRFYGDVMLGRHVETLIRQFGRDYVLKQFDTLPPVDYAVINFESAMVTPHRQTPNFTFQFATMPPNLSALDKLSVTHASLANNHTLDYGVAGFDLTVRSLSEFGITPFGHPSLVSTSTSVTLIETPTSVFALIGIHTLFRAPTDEELETVFTYASERSDRQIVYVHWGDEYVLRANQAQRALAAQFVQLGADLVVGHHPHIVQDIEVINGVPIFYSLGNFIFDQYFSGDVMDGLVIDAEFKDGLTIALYPVTSRDRQSQPRRMSEEEAGIFLSLLAERSDRVLSDMIMAGKIDLIKLAIAP